MTRTLLSGLAALLLAAAGLSAAAFDSLSHPSRKEAYRPPISIPYPASNPYSAAKATLGQTLFFDTRLSRSRTQSCATCHDPAYAWTTPVARPLGDAHRPTARRAPTLLDVALLPRLGWAGQFPDIETVSLFAISADGNMNLSGPRLVNRLAAVPSYVAAFAQAFGREGISSRTIGQALATYERSIVAGPAPFDRWVAGDTTAISAAAKRGFDLFTGRAGCAQCHSGWAFTDGSFHDIGTEKGGDIGRGALFPSSVKLRHAFKTPTLRDVALRAPYMHDGSVPTLAAVIDLYDRGGIARPSRSELIHPLGLTARDKADLLAFLRSLTQPAPGQHSIAR